MANKRFPDFQLQTSLQGQDYFVGYKSDATSELRVTFQTLLENIPTDFKYQGEDIKALSGNWENTFTTVQANSADWINNTVIQYSDSKFLPLTGGDLTGMITLSNADVQPGQTLTESVSSLIITINGQQFKLPLLPL